MKNISTFIFGFICLILLILAFLSDNYSNEIIFQSKNTKILENNKIIEKEVTLMEYKYKILKLLAKLLYTLAFSIFIATFITRYFQKLEKEKFESKILDLQKNINKNVFEGVFKNIIPSKVFEKVKRELLYNKILRKNARWEYSISYDESKNVLLLNQTLIYELKNISNEKIINPLTLYYFSNEFSTTKIEEISYCRKKDNKNFSLCDTKFIDNDKDKFNNVEHKTTTNMEFAPFEEIKFLIKIRNTYKGKYFHDNHFTNFPLLGIEIRVLFPENFCFEIIPTPISTKFIKTEINKNMY